MAGEDDEELYADLYEHLGDGRQVPKTSLLEMEERLEQLSKQEQDMRTQNETLQKQNNSLQRDKDILIRNISCLFKTAQMEIARKNKQINELREEISQLKMQVSHSKAVSVTEAQMGTKSEKLLQVETFPSVLGQQALSSFQTVDLFSRSEDLQTRGSTKGAIDRCNQSAGVHGSGNKVENYYCEEITVHGSSRTKVQHDCRENIHADECQEAIRFKSNDSDIQKNLPGDGDTNKMKSVQVKRDARGLKNFEPEARASAGTCCSENRHSFGDQYIKGKEQSSFTYDRPRECQSLEKIVWQKVDHRKDQQFIQQHKKCGINRGDSNDCTSITVLRKSIGDSDIVSGDDSHIVQTKPGGGKRKVIDTVDIQKMNYSSKDLPAHKIQKRNSFRHGKPHKTIFSCVKIDKIGTGESTDKECENDSEEDKIIDEVQSMNGSKSGRDHELELIMEKPRVLRYFSENHSHESTDPPTLFFIQEERHKQGCRDDLLSNESWIRERSKDHESQTMKDADTGDAWPIMPGADSHEVGEIVGVGGNVENMQDFIENKEQCTMSEGALETNCPIEDYPTRKGLHSDQMKNHCPQAMVNKNGSETCSVLDGSVADPSLWLQGGIDEMLTDTNVPRDFNVEGQRRLGTTSPGPEEMDNRRRKHCKESIYTQAGMQFFHGENREKKKDNQSFMGYRCQGVHEKMEKGGDLSSRSKIGANRNISGRDRGSRRANGNISDDHERRDQWDKEGRTGQRGKDSKFRRANEKHSEQRRELHSINGERTNSYLFDANDGSDIVVAREHHGYSSSKRRGRDFIQEQGHCKNRSKSEYHSSDAETNKDKRKHGYGIRSDDRHISRKSEIQFFQDRREREKNQRAPNHSADMERKPDRGEYT